MCTLSLPSQVPAVVIQRLLCRSRRARHHPDRPRRPLRLLHAHARRAATTACTPARLHACTATRVHYWARPYRPDSGRSLRFVHAHASLHSCTAALLGPPLPSQSGVERFPSIHTPRTLPFTPSTLRLPRVDVKLTPIHTYPIHTTHTSHSTAHSTSHAHLPLNLPLTPCSPRVRT